MKMPDSVQNELKRQVQAIERDSTATKEELQRLYDKMIRTYDDGREQVRWYNRYQTKWTMNI